MVKNFLRQAILAIAILVSFRGIPWRAEWVLQLDQVWVYLLVGVFIFRKSLRFLCGKIILREPEKYALFIVFYYPSIVACVTAMDWGQPLLYGVLSQRQIGHVFFPLLLLDFLMRGKIKINDVEKTLVVLSWAQLLFSLFAFVFQSDWIRHESEIKGEILKTPYHLIIVGFFYYSAYSVTRAFLREKLSAAFCSLFFLTALIVVFKGRSLVLGLLVAWAGIFLVHGGSFNKKLTWLILMAGFSLLLFPAVFWGGGEYLGPHIQSFFTACGEAFRVISGRESADASANIRLQDISYVIHSTKHWFLGNGAIYPKWVNHVQQTSPKFFFPSDIGWYGIVYLYGFFGLILANFQFVLGLRYRLSPAHLERKALFLTCQGMALFCFLRSIATMEILTFPAISLTFIFLMWYLSQKNEQNKKENDSPGREPFTSLKATGIHSQRV